MGKVRQKDDRSLYEVFVSLRSQIYHEKLSQKIEKATCSEVRVA